MKRKRGFTLAELLIVVAIIAVLVAVAIPVFGGQMEKSKQTVDMANMRAAYAVLIADYLSGEKDAGKTYYFDLNSSSIVESKPSIGYGKSSREIQGWTLENTMVAGIPNPKGGSPAVLALSIDENDLVSFRWGGGAYSGQNVTSAQQYSALSYEEKLEKDVLLLNSLQVEFRSMTYGELRELFLDENGNVKNGIASGTLNNKVCFTIANSTINGDTVNTGNKKTGIYTSDVFEYAGFDTTLDTSQTYVINSVPDTTNDLWVNLGISMNQLKALKEGDDLWNETASSAYTYVKSGGKTTPDALREANRSKMK